MKKILQYIFLTGMLLLSISLNINAQPHAGQQSDGGGVSGSRIGDAPSGAPVGSGTLLLISLAGFYGGRKVYHTKKAKLQ